MKSKLPSTPLEALNLSGVLSFIVKTIHTSADIFGFWKYPSLKSSADFERMTLWDKMYWGYKSRNPIVRPEKGSQLETFFYKNERVINLPAKFRKNQSVTFGAVGDLIKVPGLENSKDVFYEKIADLVFDNDLTIANLESQLTSQNIGGYVFSDKETPPLCCHLNEYETLTSHRGKHYTLLHTACNHTLDMGLEGLETTLARLEKDGITDIGTNRRPDESVKGRMVTKNGITFGFVSATFGLNGKPIPPGHEYMVNVVKFHTLDSNEKADLSLLEHQIAWCNEKGCDVIIASLHWGYEYEFFPRKHQVDMAHQLVEAGVDVIISHHAHVLQPMEYYRPKRNPEKTAIIVYSLGNLASAFSAPHLVLSGVLNLTFSKGTIDGREETFVTEAKLIPVIQRDCLVGNLPVIRIETLETVLNPPYQGIEDKAYLTALKRYADGVLGGLDDSQY
ncbi:MAG: CapA family protein [Candidatus Omnitrophota bacterium]